MNDNLLVYSNSMMLRKLLNLYEQKCLLWCKKLAFLNCKHLLQK